AMLSLQAIDVVRFDPVILSIVFIYFCLRYLMIRKRSAALAGGCRVSGYSDRAVNLYFGEPLEFSGLVQKVRPAARRLGLATLVGLVFALPAMLFAWSAARILASPALAPEAPKWLYGLSAILLIGFSANAAWYVLRSRWLESPAMVM